ncbi:putative alpha-xylosidase 2 [Acorus gramineus]|uniref:Alpha-xylosidase 2 n=1 Tax=Acorus gramineus TaxID=55184 RepID=A0AAV9BLS1_ACOGR|nr:putative alpha-xylosidase 2 [Acorus gramineus]
MPPPPPPLRISKKHHKHINNPFPSTPKSIPLVHGKLFPNLHTLTQHHSFPVGKDFLLSWSPKNGGYLSLSHHSLPQRTIWSTVPGQAFVSAGLAQTKAEESRGSFVIRNGHVSFICNHQSIEDIRIINQSEMGKKSKVRDLIDGFEFKSTHFPALLITGWVFSEKKAENPIKRIVGSKIKIFMSRRSRRPSVAARYCLLLDQKNTNEVGFVFRFGELNLHAHTKALRVPLASLGSQKRKLRRLQRWRVGCLTRPRSFVVLSSDDEREGIGKVREFNRVFITHSSEEDERFFGFGEQFSHMEFKGKRVPIFVQEQGIGRGDQPITFAANLVSYRAGGDWSTTYAPSPFYMTSKMKSFYLEGYSYSIFDLTKHDRVQVQIYNNVARGRILHGNSPAKLIERFTETIGRPPELPKWVMSGAIVGMQGGTEAVRCVWDILQDYSVPVSAFWLQDWVGQRETIIGSQLWWNWEVDTDQYAGWTQLVNDFQAQDVRVMAYCNPCLAPSHDKPNKKRNLFEEAKNLGILVTDGEGYPYMVANTSFDVGMLDFTHPSTSGWMKQILHEMVDSGVRGWMADFGEGLPLDAHLFSGEDPISAHNRYPELWAKVNREFVDEWKSNRHGKERDDPEESLVFFMRAGFRNSPRWAMLFWEGDQMVSWQNHDGIKSAVTGLLSSGLSGYAFNHSDIGGYCSVNLPFMKYQRTEELLLRWMELNAFNTVFRTHEGNNPSANIQFYSNSRTLSHFARFAKVYKAWKFYRIQLVKEASEKGLPVSRHLFIHYPDDKHVYSLSYQQFLVGTEILVVPVLDKGRKEVKAYFPLSGGCSWQHIWTGKIYGSSNHHNSQGFETYVEAPIGNPAVFVKSGSLVGETFMKNLKDLNIL